MSGPRTEDPNPPGVPPAPPTWLYLIAISVIHSRGQHVSRAFREGPMVVDQGAVFGWEQSIEREYTDLSQVTVRVIGFQPIGCDTPKHQPLG